MASTSNMDPAQAYLTAPASGLSSLFEPKAVALIGATERAGSVGATTMQNLMSANLEMKNFVLYPVNPTRDHVFGIKAYKSIEECPGKVDMALIITPAKTVTAMMEQCGKAGVGAVIVISAGFKEMGEEGLALENSVIATARKYNVRVVGPNCLGLMQPNYGLNATFASTMALKGNIAFASQSGAMCTAVLDWSMKENIGFSSFISIGSMADVNWGDIIDYLGSDPMTSTILIYMETIGDAASFLSAAKEVAGEKPIIVIKAGKSEAAAKAAASHTGSLAGAHDAFLAAMRRVGVMTVDTIGELFNCALALGKSERPRGPKLGIITNAGGPGVLATDAVSIGGGEVAELPQSTIEKLNEFLPEAWSHANPIDVLGDAGPAIYAKTLEVCLDDPCMDGALVILSPQSVTDATGTAKILLEKVNNMKAANGGKLPKPVMAAWMGGMDVQEGFDLLQQGGVPCYSHPDAAARTFASIWKNTKDRQLMMETPGVDAPPFVRAESRAEAVKILKIAREAGRELLTEAESKDVLKAFGIPIAETIICATEDAAAAAGPVVKFPCVVKLNSETITHKSDVGGVKLNIQSEAAIRAAFREIEENVSKIGPEHFQGVTVQPMIDLSKGIELILGAITDPQFGQMVAFGFGGCMVEIFKDSSLSLPPLNATLAMRQMEDTKIFAALKGGQGQRFPGVPLKDMATALVNFSHMVTDLSEFVSEIDINPLLALPDRAVALDARIVLRTPDTPLTSLAIRPYPREYILKGQELKDGTSVTFRPSHPGDFDRFINFHKNLSEQTVRQRYLAEVSLEVRAAHEKIHSVCCADYNRLLAFIAVEDDEVAKPEMLGILRLTRFPKCHDIAELKMSVRDDKQGKGMGTLFLDHALNVAKQEKLKELRTTVLNVNTGFIKLLERKGFSSSPTENPLVFQCTYKVPC